jgi:hypothetical protein
MLCLDGVSDPRLRPLERVRSTLLCSGLTELRARGLFDAYRETIDRHAGDIIVNTTVGVWLPMDVAMEHFRACDAVVPTASDAFAIGAGSGQRVQASVLAAIIRLATGAGASPWTVFQNYDRLWRRVFDGGAVTIHRRGPKDALIELRGMPISQFAYFRNAFRGANDAALRLFAKTLYVRELVERNRPTGFTMRAAWA